MNKIKTAICKHYPLVFLPQFPHQGGYVVNIHYLAVIPITILRQHQFIIFNRRSPHLADYNSGCLVRKIDRGLQINPTRKRKNEI